MPVKTKTVYICKECGEQSPRWVGKCPSCGSWNTLEESVQKQDTGKALQKSARREQAAQYNRPQPLDSVEGGLEQSRLKTGIAEFDRVLGGGIVQGALMLLAGEPGAGKSTLLLQVAALLSQKGKVLYNSGEESAHQIKMRAERLSLSADKLLLSTLTDLADLKSAIAHEQPMLVVVDSIQTLRDRDLESIPGSLSQVRECTSALLDIAKNEGIPIFLIGHVNKDGAIAGPKVMEHTVDTVLYFEGDRTLPYRILRAVKNRYGSTNEIGIFDLGQTGLREVKSPSAMLLEGRPMGISGNCVLCAMEGSRPVLAEVQALATKSAFSAPRRTSDGIDLNRLYLLMAVLEKRLGYTLGTLDLYLNIVGGLQITETAADLPVVLAVVSSVLDKPLPDDLVAMGEVGLGGEIRGVQNIELRLKEAARMGFKTALVPKQNLQRQEVKINGLQIIGAGDIGEAVDVILNLEK